MIVKAITLHHQNGVLIIKPHKIDAIWTETNTIHVLVGVKDFIVLETLKQIEDKIEKCTSSITGP